MIAAEIPANGIGTARRRRHRVARTIAAALLTAAALALSASPLLAQQPAPRRLSLAEALQLAERDNPQLRQAANDVDVAEAARRAASATYFPDLRASVDLGGSSTRTITGVDEFGTPVRGESRTFQSSSASQSLSSGLTLWDGGARGRRVGAAREQIHAAEATVLARRAEIAAQLSAQYFRARNAQSRIVLEERLVQSAREQLDATERRFRIAAASREDVLGADADVATAQARLETARGDALKAALVLKQLIGLEDAAPLELTDSVPRPPADLPLDADLLVAQSLAQHPSLAAAQARADAAHASAAAARGARWPTVSARAGYSRSDRANDYGALFDINPVGSQGFNFGLSASVPVFDRFQTGSNVAAADAQAEDAAETVRQERLRLEQEVRSAVIDVENARRSLALAERAAALSRERVELARERYQAGATDFIQFQQVQRSAAEAERQELDARLQLAVAWAQLQEKVGAP